MEKKGPMATHSGTWSISDDIYFKCYVMDNNERVLSLRGAAQSMGLKGGGSVAVLRNLNSQWIKPYLSHELHEWLYKANTNTLPDYWTEGGRKFQPITASAFMDICSAYVKADKDGVLVGTQQEVANRMFIIMSAFSKVGLVALIDEVTGFQADREKDALQKILKLYISSELLPWTERFPREFYKQLFRLKKWKLNGSKRPGIVGKITNNLIYDKLPLGVLNELRSKTPKGPSGRYSAKFHQSLSEETGVIHLDRQLQQTIALMKASDSWEQFEKLFNRAMGEPDQISLFEDEE